MRLRPCIDLHGGKVKQIVGSSLSDLDEKSLKTNFSSEKPPSYYAELYRQDGLTGGHVIMLGPGNEKAAKDALSAWPGGMQVGGGITADNAMFWLEQGAAAVIVTSYVFSNGQLLEDNLKKLVSVIGKDRLVIDLSCRKRGDKYFVVTDRWQKFTEVEISPETLEYFAGFCFEFLIHAADVEGKCEGVAKDLVKDLAEWTSIPTTYAGGVKDMKDLQLIRELGRGQLDVTVGSALDIFGGTGVAYRDAVSYCSRDA